MKIKDKRQVTVCSVASREVDVEATLLELGSVLNEIARDVATQQARTPCATRKPVTDDDELRGKQSSRLKGDTDVSRS